jgi:hypothetical protein
VFSKEPAVILGALAEVVKAIIPALIIFGILKWTADQVAAVMFVVGVAVSSFTVILTRNSTTPEADVNALIRTATHQEPGTKPEVVKEIQAQKDEGKV